MFYNFRKNKKAFTLVELIVVVAIIAVLGTVVGIAVGSALSKAKKNSSRSNASTIVTEINNYIANGDDASTLKTVVEENQPTLKSHIDWGSAGGKTASELDKDAMGNTTYTITYTQDKFKTTIKIAKGNAYIDGETVKA